MSLIGRLGPFLTRSLPRVYTTWNPADKAAGITLSNGNLTATITTAAISQVRAVVGITQGKWYWECTLGTNANAVGPKIGIATASASLNNWTGAEATSWGYFPNNGGFYTSGALGSTVATSTTGDVIGFALDMVAGTLVLYKNGVLLGTLASGLTGRVYPAGGTAGNVWDFTANFGATAFVYTVPSGYNPGLY